MKENSDIRKELIEHLEIQLKPSGFKKKATSLYRETEQGLIQTIDFSLGPSHSIMRDHIGLGFGVYTDEWHEHFGFGPKPTVITKSHCELRSDFNNCLPQVDNFSWIDVKQDFTEVQKRAQTLIDTYFIPQLDRLTTRRQIIEQWKRKGNAIGLPPRGRLSIAILHYYLNEKEKALRLMNVELLRGIVTILLGKKRGYYDLVRERKAALLQNAP